MNKPKREDFESLILYTAACEKFMTYQTEQFGLLAKDFDELSTEAIKTATIVKELQILIKKHGY